MKFHPTPLSGAFTIELDKRGDDRGFFARLFCDQEFGAAGIPTAIAQINNALSSRAGTLRGMHYQLTPSAEIKVVRCIRGAVYDVIVDLRPDSPTFTQWFGTELSAENRLMMYAPRGFAHGIMTSPTMPKRFISQARRTIRSGNAACATTIRALESRGRGPLPKFPRRIGRGPISILTFMALNRFEAWFENPADRRKLLHRPVVRTPAGGSRTSRRGASQRSPQRILRPAQGTRGGARPCCRSGRKLSVRVHCLHGSGSLGQLGYSMSARISRRRLSKSGIRRRRPRWPKIPTISRRFLS